MICRVCARPKTQHLKVAVERIDGVDCRICEECGGDIFRRKRAVELTLGKPYVCGCESCRLRENGDGRQLAIPATSTELPRE